MNLLSLCGHPNRSVAALARAALAGDASALGPLQDIVLEQEVLMSALRVGSCYLVTTVTYTYTGRLVSEDYSEIVLDEAARIYDTGRFGAFLRRGIPTEAEPYPGEVIISRASVVDVTLWTHPLIRSEVG